MTHLILAATIAVASPSPAPTVSALPAAAADAPRFAGPATFPTPTPAPYTPTACAKLIARAHLAGKVITADSLGQLMAAALKLHGVNGGSNVDRTSLAKSVIDFVGCFQGAEK